MFKHVVLHLNIRKIALPQTQGKRIESGLNPVQINHYKIGLPCSLRMNSKGHKFTTSSPLIGGYLYRCDLNSCSINALVFASHFMMYDNILFPSLMVTLHSLQLFNSTQKQSS